MEDRLFHMIIVAVSFLLVNLGSTERWPPQDDDISNGTSGEPCGNLICHTNATCVSRSCECNEGFKGDGRILCTRNNTFVGEVVGDPVAVAMDNSRFHVPYPCRYLLSHIITTHDVGKNGGSCDLKIFGMNYFIDNGYYVLGVDVEVKIMDDLEPGLRVEGALRVQGVENHDGQFRYTHFSKVNSIGKRSRWLSRSTNITFGSLVIKTELDKVNNVIMINSPECGVYLGYRAFVRHSHMLPGLLLAVEDKPGLVFSDTSDALMSTPFNFETPHIEELKKQYKLSTKEAALFLSLNQNTRQDFGMGAVPCHIASTQFTQVCTEKWEQAFAMKMCSFLYTNKGMTSCLLSDAFGESIGSMFGLCAQAMCWRHKDLCEDVKETLVTYDCDADIPHFFIDLDCSDLNSAMSKFNPNP